MEGNKMGRKVSGTTMSSEVLDQQSKSGTGWEELEEKNSLNKKEVSQ
jgi:hypothetical protein